MPGTDTTNYRHAPLADDKDIRILHVQADPSTSQPLCSFQCVSFDDHPEYIAISYSLGRDLQIVRTLPSDDGGSVELNSTLSRLIDSLKLRFGTFTVWIDALCINQHDSAEKGCQVGRMGQVYSFALMVIVWLGEGTESFAAAFRLISEQNAQSLHQDLESALESSGLVHADVLKTDDKDSGIRGHADQTALASLWNLLERPWFRRVWVIQEATLGKNISVLCGNDLIPFIYLERSLLSLWAAHGTEDMFDIDKPAYQALWCANRLFEIRDMYIASGSRGAVYERLLESTFHFLATDSRDFVFALQGLASTNDALLEPNYTDSTEAIFRDAAARLLCQGKSLDMLALAGSGRRRRYVDLPTWAPDFRQNPFSEPLWTSDKAGWKAGGTLQTQPSLSPGSLLRIEAIAFDKVAVQGPKILSFSFPTLRNSLSTLLSMGKDLDTYPTGESWHDVVWKTLIEGLDDQHKPVAHDFIDHFIHLRKLLGKVPWEIICGFIIRRGRAPQIG
jgi:hypothetical protein